MPLTGLQHMVCNKIRLSGQRENFDHYPRVINVRAGGNHENGFIAVTVPCFGASSNVGFQLAGELLTATVKRLAFALVKKSDEKQQWVQELNKIPRELLNNLRNASALITGESFVLILTKQTDLVKPVRKITLNVVTGTGSTSIGSKGSIELVCIP